MNPVEQLFESIDKTTIHRFVAERRQEDICLDFKTIQHADDLVKEDRKCFARAVAGFANSSGGVIVWGVDARKHEGVDAASALCPTRNVRSKLSAFESLTGQATIPEVSAVRHNLVYEDEVTDTGYIVTLVPESDRGPHMAKLGEHAYYKRSGDSFYKMEHFDIADMFGRRHRPSLSLDIGLHCHSTSGAVEERVYHVSMVLSIRNSGRGIAKYPRMDFQVFPPYSARHDTVVRREEQYYKKIRRLSNTDSKYTHAFFGNADDVVHPNSALEVAMLNAVEMDERARLPKKFIINVRLWAEGAIETEKVIAMSGDEVLGLLRQTKAYKDRHSR